jgi:hypothetical protein
MELAQNQIKFVVSYFLSTKARLSFISRYGAVFILPKVVLNSGIVFCLAWLMREQMTYAIDFILSDNLTIANLKHFFQHLTNLSLFCYAEFLCFVKFCLTVHQLPF